MELSVDFTLDIEAFCRGTCRVLEVRGDTVRRRYEEKLRRWTEDVGWAMMIGLLWREKVNALLCKNMIIFIINKVAMHTARHTRARP